MVSEKEGELIKLTTPSGTIDINYHEAGEGRNHVIFVQTGGAGTSAYMCWYLNMPAFAKSGYYCFAPDVPGFGRSRITAGKPNRTEFLSAFMDAKAIDRAHFIGNSMGSMTITQFAIDKPERVKSIILTGGEPRVETEESRAIAPTLGRTARMDFVREMLSKPEVSFEDMRKATGHYFCDPDHPKVSEVAEMRLSIMRRPGVLEKERDGAFKQIQGGRSNFTASDMAKIQAPTYLIHGRDERFFYSKETAPILIECAVKAAFVIPDCACTLLPRCGHWPQLERSETFNTLSLEFLDSLKAPLDAGVRVPHPETTR